jgi:hypothetical protein
MMRSKNSIAGLVAVALVAAVALLSPSVAQADPIIGSIGFSGVWAPDGGTVATTTGVDIVGDVAVVLAVSGDFAPFVTPIVDTATYNDFTFSPSTATPGLWSVGGFTFDLATSSIVLQNSLGITLSGTGTVSGNGFDPTSGVWSWSGDNTGSTVVFSSTTTTEDQVPEPASLLLFGTGLAAAAAGLRRRQRHKA